jgi:hypothetical protein
MFYYILSAEGNYTIGGYICSQAGAKPAFFFCHQFKTKYMKYLVVIMLSFVLFSCSKSDGKSYVVVNSGVDDENRPLFNVMFANGFICKDFYAEEVANGLITGQWKRNQDLVITESSEFQLFMEEDSVVIYDFGRKLGTIANGECNKLDDILNQE